MTRTDRKPLILSFLLGTNLIEGSDRDAQDLLIKGQWRVDANDGALLLMHKPLRTHIPEDVFQAFLDNPVLKNKWLVSEVWNCTGYFMYHFLRRE
jgi:hypothetical protein